MKFLKIILDHFFSILENRDGHLAGLIEAKPEVLGKITHIENMCHFTFYNFDSCKFSVSAIVKAL